MPPEDNNPPSQPTTGNFGAPKNSKLKLIGLVIVVVVLALLGLALGLRKKPAAPPTTPPVTAVEEAYISVTGEGFVPQTLKVKPGTRVTWTNQDGAPHLIASDPHPTHEGLKGLEGTALSNGDSYSYTFGQVGTYTYHDHLNPLNSKFRGTVVVE